MGFNKKISNRGDVKFNSLNHELSGGGGGSKHEVVNLYSGDARGLEQIELKDDITNYDYLIVYFSFGNDARAFAPLFIDVDFLLSNCPYKVNPSYEDGHFFLALNSTTNQWARLLSGEDSRHLTIWLTSGSINAVTVNGIKL